ADHGVAPVFVRPNLQCTPLQSLGSPPAQAAALGSGSLFPPTVFLSATDRGLTRPRRSVAEAGMPKSEHRSDGDGRDERDVRRRRHSHDRQSDGEEHERCRRSRGDRKDDEKSEHRSDGRRRHSHDRQYDGEEHERYRRSRGDRKDDEMSPQHRVLEDEEKESKRRRRERGPEEEGRVQKPQGKGEIRFDKDNSLPFEAQSSRFLLLDNIFDKSVERDKEFYLQIREEVHTKCALKGYVVHAIHVDRKKMTTTGDLGVTSKEGNLSPQLSVVIIPEAKQGDMKHGTVVVILATQDVLEQRVSAVAHVGERSFLPGPQVRGASSSGQFVDEHLAPCRRLLPGAAAGHDWAAANMTVAAVVKANPRVEVGVEVGLACEGQRPIPKLLPRTSAGVQGAGAGG
ncbi:hypothetical protein U9M48_012353, partial [Paspalum notatum var. saurae]